MNRVLSLAVALSLSGLSPNLWAGSVSGHLSPSESFDTNVAAGGRWLAGALLISAVDGLSEVDLKEPLGRVGCEVHHRFGKRSLYRATCSEQITIRKQIAVLEGEPAIAWVEPYWFEEMEETPNDLTSNQWHHLNDGQTIDGLEGIVGADIGSIAAWDVTVGNGDPLIALIDTGIYRAHEELQGRLFTNPFEICGNGIDEDDNGYVDDCEGWDVADEDADPDSVTLPDDDSEGDTCKRWHATGIAGLAVATGNNVEGIAGVNWNGTVLNIKKYPDSSCLSMSGNSAEGVAYGIDMGANVLVMAFSGDTYSQTFQNLLKEADEKGIFSVMSAGNDREDVDETLRYPNYYDIDLRITVANSTVRDKLGSGSNYGASYVDMMAPGSDLRTLSTLNESRLRTRTGTSYSTGLVAGALSLGMSAYPTLTSQQLYAALMEGVTPLEALDCSLTDRCVRTGGRLSIPGFLERAAVHTTGPELEVTATLSETDENNVDHLFSRHEALTLTVSVTNTGDAPAHELVLSFPGAPEDLKLPIDSEGLGSLDPRQTRTVTYTDDLWLNATCVSNLRGDLLASVTSVEGATGEGSAVVYRACDVDYDGDGYRLSEDCDDENPDIYPGAPDKAKQPARSS